MSRNNKKNNYDQSLTVQNKYDALLNMDDEEIIIAPIKKTKKHKKIVIEEQNEKQIEEQNEKQNEKQI